MRDPDFPYEFRGWHVTILEVSDLKDGAWRAKVSYSLQTRMKAHWFADHLDALPHAEPGVIQHIATRPPQPISNRHIEIWRFDGSKLILEKSIADSHKEPFSRLFH
jgi:hypothetical protein